MKMSEEECLDVIRALGYAIPEFTQHKEQYGVMLKLSGIVHDNGKDIRVTCQYYILSEVYNAPWNLDYEQTTFKEMLLERYMRQVMMAELRSPMRHTLNRKHVETKEGT